MVSRMRRACDSAFARGRTGAVDRSDQDRRDRRRILGRRRVADQSRRHGGRRHQRPWRYQRPQGRGHHLRRSLVGVRRGARLPARRQPGQGRRRHRQLHQRGGAGARAMVGAAAHAVHHARRRQQSDLQGRPRRLRPLQVHVPRLADVGVHRPGDLRLHQGHAGRTDAHENRRGHERGRRLDHAAR